MREGKPATSEPVNRRARAGIETALEIGTGSQRSAITATTFHEMLRPAACFLRTRTTLPIISGRVSVNKIAADQSGATASVQRLAQLLPSQMSEPWHVSKPARQTGCRLRRSTGAGLTDGRRGDQRGQRTVGSVAFTVRRRGPSAEGLGLRNASGSRNVQHEEDGKLGHVERGDEERVRVVEDTTSRGQAAPTRHAFSAALAQRSLA